MANEEKPVKLSPINALRKLFEDARLAKAKRYATIGNVNPPRRAKVASAPDKRLHDAIAKRLRVGLGKAERIERKLAR